MTQMKKKSKLSVSRIISIIIARSFGAVAVGWLYGWLVKLVFGSMVADGLNIIFATTRFTENNLMIVVATVYFFLFLIKPINGADSKDGQTNE